MDNAIAQQLALTAAAISVSRDFEIEVNSKSPERNRFDFANYLLDEYNYFYDYYLNHVK